MEEVSLGGIPAYREDRECRGEMESTSHPASGRVSLWAAGAEGPGELWEDKCFSVKSLQDSKGCGMCVW